MALAVIRDADGEARHYTTDAWNVVARYRAEKPRHTRERLPLLLAANVASLRLARAAMPGERPEVLDRHPDLMGWLDAEIARADAFAAGDGAQGKARVVADAGPAGVSIALERREKINEGENNVNMSLFQDATVSTGQDDLFGGRAAA
jgi:hypothetical protein